MVRHERLTSALHEHSFSLDRHSVVIEHIPATFHQFDAVEGDLMRFVHVSEADSGSPRADNDSIVFV